LPIRHPTSGRFRNLFVWASYQQDGQEWRREPATPDRVVFGLRALLTLGDVEFDLLSFLEARYPPPTMAEKCTNTSGPPPST
jgi:hypothetical protein